MVDEDKAAARLCRDEACPLQWNRNGKELRCSDNLLQQRCVHDVIYFPLIKLTGTEMGQIDIPSHPPRETGTSQPRWKVFERKLGD